MYILFLLLNYSLIFYKVLKNTNYKKILLKFLVLSVAINMYHVAHCKGDNSYI